MTRTRHPSIGNPYKKSWSTHPQVLLLLDCYAAAHSVERLGRFYEGGQTEVIAACGLKSTAPGPGSESFTQALLEEIESLSRSQEIFSTATLFVVSCHASTMDELLQQLRYTFGWMEMRQIRIYHWFLWPLPPTMMSCRKPKAMRIFRTISRIVIDFYLNHYGSPIGINMGGSNREHEGVEEQESERGHCWRLLGCGHDKLSTESTSRDCLRIVDWMNGWMFWYYVYRDSHPSEQI